MAPGVAVWPGVLLIRREGWDGGRSIASQGGGAAREPGGWHHSYQRNHQRNSQPNHENRIRADRDGGPDN